MSRCHLQGKKSHPWPGIYSERLKVMGRGGWPARRRPGQISLIKPGIHTNRTPFTLYPLILPPSLCTNIRVLPLSEWEARRMNDSEVAEPEIAAETPVEKHSRDP
jgi:hypothetical protein